MNEVVNFLNENPVQYLATVDKEGNPKVRPFQFMFAKDGKLFFCTSNQKNIYKELNHNARIELCVSSPTYIWMRLSGKSVFSNDMEIKTAILEHSPLVRSIYKTPDNPVFEIFYIENARATISDFSGQPPRTFNL